jgi:1-acyl-sn-glycerol-3-phosphate acyltransferase
MPGLLEFHMGAFLVAARTGTPVLPVTIRGTQSVLRGEQWFPRHGRISVHTGKLHLPDGDDFEAAVRLRDRVRMSILKYSGEPDLALEKVTLTQT